MGFVDKIIDIYIKSLCVYVYVLHSRELDMTAMEEIVGMAWKCSLLYKESHSIFCALVLDTHLKTHLKYSTPKLMPGVCHCNLASVFWISLGEKERRWAKASTKKKTHNKKPDFCHRNYFYLHCIHLNLVAFRSAVKLPLISTFLLGIKWGSEMASFRSTPPNLNPYTTHLSPLVHSC